MLRAFWARAPSGKRASVGPQRVRQIPSRNSSQSSPAGRPGSNSPHVVTVLLKHDVGHPEGVVLGASFGDLLTGSWHFARLGGLVPEIRQPFPVFPLSWLAAPTPRPRLAASERSG